MERIRLQGKKWSDKKEQLTKMGFDRLPTGKIKGYYRDDRYKEYIHYLNDDEIKELGTPGGNNGI